MQHVVILPISTVCNYSLFSISDYKYTISLVLVSYSNLTFFCRWPSAKGSSEYSTFLFPMWHTRLPRNRCRIASCLSSTACTFILFLMYLLVHICIVVLLSLLSCPFFFFLSLYYSLQVCRYTFPFRLVHYIL